MAHGRRVACKGVSVYKVYRVVPMKLLVLHRVLAFGGVERG
jgi:hypothetical protein